MDAFVTDFNFAPDKFVQSQHLMESLDMDDLLISLLDRAIRLVKAERGMLILRTDNENGFEGDIMGDRQKLWRALYNIAKNAGEAMAGEKGKDKVLIIASRQNDHWIEFALTDTEPGILPELRDKIFLPFATYGKSHGAGLGLSIARSIAESHGGKIDLTTEVGEGAAFTISIPLEVTSV